MAAVRADLAEPLFDRIAAPRPLPHRRVLGPRNARATSRSPKTRVTGERVAVRLLRRELSAAAIQRSRRSIIAASAAHPAFVRVLDSGETSDGRSFMVMELAEGGA